MVIRVLVSSQREGRRAVRKGNSLDAVVEISPSSSFALSSLNAVAWSMLKAEPHGFVQQCWHIPSSQGYETQLHVSTKAHLIVSATHQWQTTQREHTEPAHPTKQTLLSMTSYVLLPRGLTAWKPMFSTTHQSRMVPLVWKAWPPQREGHLTCSQPL